MLNNHGLCPLTAFKITVKSSLICISHISVWRRKQAHSLTTTKKTSTTIYLALFFFFETTILVYISTMFYLSRITRQQKTFHVLFHKKKKISLRKGKQLAQGVQNCVAGTLGLHHQALWERLTMSGKQDAVRWITTFFTLIVTHRRNIITTSNQFQILLQDTLSNW